LITTGHELRNNRCLISTSGIYEHREVKSFKNKIPYFVKLANRSTFFIPGLYSYSDTPDVETGEVKGVFVLITRPANEVMRLIHNGGDQKWRMPLFLQPEMALEWIKNDLTDLQIHEILSHELPSEELDYHPVYTIRGINHDLMD
jgi:putative SOS response-associated peptidase YedK